jgi:hypothetical protein
MLTFNTDMRMNPKAWQQMLLDALQPESRACRLKTQPGIDNRRCTKSVWLLSACLYAPGVLKLDDIEAIVRAVAPKPINVLVSRPGVTVAQLADLGVRRISVGSALSRVAWAAFARATEEIATGSFEAFKDVSASPDLNKIFE